LSGLTRCAGVRRCIFPGNSPFLERWSAFPHQPRAPRYQRKRKNSLDISHPPPAGRLRLIHSRLALLLLRTCTSQNKRGCHFAVGLKRERQAHRAGVEDAARCRHAAQRRGAFLHPFWPSWLFFLEKNCPKEERDQTASRLQISPPTCAVQKTAGWSSLPAGTVWTTPLRSREKIPSSFLLPSPKLASPQRASVAISVRYAT
jgi:hypothetical protein